MRVLRITLGAALLLGAAPLATASQARCTEPMAYVCSAVALACRTADDAVAKDLNCPQF